MESCPRFQFRGAPRNSHTYTYLAAELASSTVKFPMYEADTIRPPLYKSNWRYLDLKQGGDDVPSETIRAESKESILGDLPYHFVASLIHCGFQSPPCGPGCKWDFHISNKFNA